MHLTYQTQLFPLVERSCDQTHHFDYHIDHFDHFDHHLDHSLKGPVIRHITLTIILINDHADHFDHHRDHFDEKSKFIDKKIQPKKELTNVPGILNWSWCPNHHITIIIISAINKGSILIIMGHHQLSIEISIQNIRIIIIIRAISIASMIDESWDTTNYQFRYRQKLLQGLDRSYCPS